MCVHRLALQSASAGPRLLQDLAGHVSGPSSAQDRSSSLLYSSRPLPRLRPFYAADPQGLCYARLPNRPGDGRVANKCPHAGVGFAIGIDTVRRVVPQLIATGKVVRPALNIQVRAMKQLQHQHSMTLPRIAPAEANACSSKVIHWPCALRAQAQVHCSKLCMASCDWLIPDLSCCMHTSAAPGRPSQDHEHMHSAHADLVRGSGEAAQGESRGGCSGRGPKLSRSQSRTAAHQAGAVRHCCGRHHCADR